jgi:hypothetical protein
MRKETSFRKSPRNSSGSSAAKPRRRAEASVGDGGLGTEQTFPCFVKVLGRSRS